MGIIRLPSFILSLFYKRGEVAVGRGGEESLSCYKRWIEQPKDGAILHKTHFRSIMNCHLETIFICTYLHVFVPAGKSRNVFFRKSHQVKWPHDCRLSVQIDSPRRIVWPEIEFIVRSGNQPGLTFACPEELIILKTPIRDTYLE